MKMKNFIFKGLLVLSLVSSSIPVFTYAGCKGDGVKQSKKWIESSSNSGNRGVGYVDMDSYHTTTVKLYHKDSTVKKGSCSGSGKVQAQTGWYKKYGTDLSVRVFYK